MRPDQIRVLALGIIWRGDELLLMECYDPTKRQTYFRPLGGGVRPLGGGVEFGEHAREAMIREFAEELGVELVNTDYLCTLENTLTLDG
jgi:8-oxo-dGTP pyrophosphatase MutT (NUDIX family)